MRILILISFLVIISTSSTTAHALCFHNHEQSNKRQTKVTNPCRRSAAYPTSWLNNARRGGSIVCRKNNDPVAHTCLGESNMSGERDNQRTNPSPMIPGSTIIIGWVTAMSIFIVKNYASADLWPTPQLAEIPIPYLSLIHNLSNMVFSGSIITTTIIEWIVTDSNDFKIIPFWFDRIQRVERFLVLPALFLSIVSGIVRANVTYGTSLMDSPLHIKSSLHLLATFGLWWGITDRTTINRVSSLVEGEEEEDEKGNTTCNTITNTRSKEGNVDVVQEVQIPFNKRLVKIRRISNIISCGFLVASYAMMTLKPGLGNY